MSTEPDHDRHPALNTPHRNPRSLTTLPDILSVLAIFQSEEAKLSNSLTTLLSSQEPIVSVLDRLHSLAPKLDELHLEASLLSETVSCTAETAERVGGSVRSLDEEMSRVRQAGERVGQVMELKESLASLQSSIDGQDWESATRHCSRAMGLPPDVISGSFTEIAVPTSESHLPPAQTLQASREKLLSIFMRNFEQASRSRDTASTSRFFKLFPVIGWEAEGLRLYASFVVDLVRVKPPSFAKSSSPLYYTMALTALFENIAIIVDQHQPVVEKYYGAGKMASVINRLLDECDRVVNDLIERWKEERSINRKLTDTSSMSFIPSGEPFGNRKFIDKDSVDPREIDKVLSELAGMAGRWQLFKKFLVQKLQQESSETRVAGELETITKLNSPSNSLPLDSSQTNESITTQKLFDDLLSNYYIPLEVWYVRATIEKAHCLSNYDLTQLPAVTTTPDDVFYILKTVLLRLLSTGSLKTVDKTIGHLRDIMDHDYASVIKKKLNDVYRNAGSSTAKDKSEKENRLSFIVLLNDLDISSSHVERLTKDVVSNSSVSHNYLDFEQPSVKNAILTLSTLAPKFRSILRAGVEQLFNQLMRPKLRTLINDIYKDVSYLLDDESYSHAEYQDLVKKRFIKAWEGLVEGYKEPFTDGNYRLFFSLTLDVLLRPWEKVVMGLKYTELGAVRFDRDIRSVMTYLSSQTTFGDVREKFLRLQQISMLVNLDSDENVDEFYSSSGITWKLSVEEARTIVSLRI